MTPKDVSDRLHVLTAEHSASRAEILQLSTKQQQILITSFAVTAYAFTNLILKQDLSYNVYLLPHAWLILSLVLLALDLMFVDCDRAIIRCATYVEGFLKVEITRLLMGPVPVTSGDRSAFNNEVRGDMSGRASTLHTVAAIKQIIKEGTNDPRSRVAEDCRVLEWESYIRGWGKSSALGDGYLKYHIPNFKHHPSNLRVQSSLIYVPAVLCYAGFIVLAVVTGIRHFHPIAELTGKDALYLILGLQVIWFFWCFFLAVLGLIFLRIIYKRNYVTPVEIEDGFPPVRGR